jgi:glycosyltransferase involved in cell wall biosynthesis
MIDPACPDYTNTPVSEQRPRFAYVPKCLSAAPCVTIVTPFYNTDAVFHETARSVLRQSLQQWEWLIINDGSTDPSSLAILESYRHCDPRIRIIDHNANRGPSAARNTGFQVAQTQYVVQLDSDDLLEPTAVEKWLWFLESHPEFAFIKGYSVGFGAQEYLWQKGFHSGSAFLEDNLVATTSAIRKALLQAVGGYDEALRTGLEDWDFWLRCASSGYWGGTIPEYLDWYRRRQTHNDRWTIWDNTERQRAFQARLRQKYPHLWNGGFPRIQPRWPMPNDTVSDEVLCENRLRKDKPRLLMIVPWLTLGGADKFNLDALEQLTRRGWEVTVATTLKGDLPWLPSFARYTPDIFILHHFLRLADYPRFLRYLIQSRQVDIVLVSNSELGYLLLPYLRACFPDVAFLDFCHMEQEDWKNGGYPRMAVEYQELLDVNVVSSEHLKQWLVKRGADPQRVRVCYTNIDPTKWHPPDPDRREAIRREFGVNGTVPVILYAGRICTQKQPSVFAHTIRRLSQRAFHFVTLVAGDGPELEWLRSFVKRQGLSGSVRLLGAVANERVQELMVAADIFFLPSQWEGIALSMYEAMACGLPVIGADVGGQRELITPECGVLVARSNEENEAEQYARILGELLQDAGRRREMGQAGRRQVETHFRLEQMGEGLTSLLQEAMRLHVTQPRPVPGLGLGRACAAQAVEYVRLSDVADGLWREREQAQAGPLGFHPYLLDPHSDSWRTLAYFAIRRLLLRYYRAALERKVMRWLLPFKNRLKRTLLREARP